MDPVMDLESVRQKTASLIASLPRNVTLVAAGKTRSAAELQAAVEAGVGIIGHNYVQEAAASKAAFGPASAELGIRWHMIGHLQRNKAKQAAEIFDLIETVDSLRLGQALEKACAAIDKIMPVLVEVNSAFEGAKSGAAPGEVEELVRGLAACPHLRVEGLMTMGLFTPDPEVCRPFFRLTRKLFEHIRSQALPGVEMRHLSMGMSSSYQVAIQEGATMVRIGTHLFGPR